MGRLLCRIGWHRWRQVGFANLMLTSYAYRCSRDGCKAGKEDSIYGLVTIYDDATIWDRKGE